MDKKLFFLFTLLTGCAFVHNLHQQNVDSRILQSDAKKFEFLMSEMGVELAEGAKWVSVFAKDKKTSQAADNAAGIIALFQFGPRTGNPVYSTKFANELSQKIHHICGPKEISGLTFLRETNKYPVVSGEIIKVSGYCLPRKTK